MPPPAGRRRAGAAPGRSTPTRSTAPSSWTSTPPRRAEQPARAGRAAQEGGLGERLGVERGRRERGGARSGRSTRARRWPGRAGGGPRRRRRAAGRRGARGPDVATPPATRSVAAAAPVSGCSTTTSHGVAGDAQVAAAVDDDAPRAAVAQQLRGGVGREALRRAARVEAQAGRPRDRARGVVDRHGAPAALAPRRGRGARRRGGERGREVRARRRGGAPRLAAA